MSRFTGKVALITGASSGIGEAIAVAFAKEGAKVAITGRNKERLAKVAKECKRNKGSEVLELIADVADFGTLKPLVDKTTTRFGGIDILVNNAGVAPFDILVENCDPKTYNDVFDINVKAPFFLSQYALPHLKKSKGCIINVSSVLSKKSSPGSVAYCMTKCALDNFTRGLAAESSARGVRVNSLNPGVVSTRLFQSDEVKEEFAAGQPFGILSPVEMADAVLFIASAPRMSGTNLVLDGGFFLDKA